MEKLIRKGVIRHMINNGFLSDRQHGFVPGRSCMTFRPTGSTTAVIVAILHSITKLLYSNPYVVVLALDLGKTFDTVRHATL